MPLWQFFCEVTLKANLKKIKKTKLSKNQFNVGRRVQSEIKEERTEYKNIFRTHHLTFPKHP